MLPVRIFVILAALFSVLFWAAPSSLAQQRRVFTNEDFPQPAPPAPPTAAEEPAPTAEGTPAKETAPSGFEEPQPDPNLPPALSLANFLQGTLQRFHSEFAAMLGEEIDPARQERLRTMMDLTQQLLTHNLYFIADLKAQQEQAEAQAQAQGGAPPAQ